MLRWAIVFLILSLIAGIFGFTGISLASMGMAKIIFTIFIVLFCITLLMHLLGLRKKP